MERAFTVSTEGTIAVVAICLAVALPLTNQEGYAFVHFIRPPVRDLLGGFDPANHILETLLTKRAVGLLRLSAFSLRAADLVGLALYLRAVARLVRGRWWAIALAGAGYLALGYGAPGAALGLGLALWTCALEAAVGEAPNLNLAGLWLGLSVAANFWFLIPGTGLAVWLAGKTGRFGPWMERVVVTATVTAFILLALPFSHATAGQLAELLRPPRWQLARGPEDLSGLVAALRRDARGKTVRIAATDDLAPVLEYYQARYREGGWRIVAFADAADYEVAEARQVEGAGKVLYRGRSVVLARSSRAGT